VVKTWGGSTKTTSGSTATTNDDYTYEDPVIVTTCRNADITNDCIVDIDQNMIPVKYTGNTTTPTWSKADIGALGDWYDYEAQKWANAVTVTPSTLATYRAAAIGTPIPEADILGYWTYIPRYEYQVCRPNASTSITVTAGLCRDGNGNNVTSTATPYNFNIRFQKNTQTTSYNGTTIGGWTTHPAFTFGTTKLNGFWVGKFETTGTNTNPTIKPNSHANISEYIGEFFQVAESIAVNDPVATGGTTPSPALGSQNSHNLATAKSHMQKNSEWGAMAYLSASIYGAGVNNVQINAAYPSTSADADGTSSRYGITGCGPSANGSTNTYTNGTALSATTTSSPTACSSSTARAYHGTLGQLASTTNSVYGVYDMVGGTWEYVMGNYNNTSNTTYMTTVPVSPYLDLYMNSIFSDNDYFTNNNQCTWATCGGHALHETKLDQPISSAFQSWGDGYSYFVDSSNPWFTRGGYGANGSSAGVFASYGSYGDVAANVGFRVSLGGF
jgi:hypothetical protein